MDYYYNPEIKLLLINQSDKKVTVTYGNHKFKLPKIGQRPPYYTNPTYQQYYPKI
ncbi:hypothetical protein [Paucisalibacillus globulus]|uniref:hypothetical protein n=1 Tax=Paucisalibacillus globulus TaxID=351095 RepID=UPI0015971711|nr:hypothetical protein [Paucisalibacillus globulus]